MPLCSWYLSSQGSAQKVEVGSVDGSEAGVKQRDVALLWRAACLVFVACPVAFDSRGQRWIAVKRSNGDGGATATKPTARCSASRLLRLWLFFFPCSHRAASPLALSGFAPLPRSLATTVVNVAAAAAASRAPPSPAAARTPTAPPTCRCLSGGCSCREYGATARHFFAIANIELFGPILATH
jgi:hypothetical protein